MVAAPESSGSNLYAKAQTLCAFKGQKTGPVAELSKWQPGYVSKHTCASTHIGGSRAADLLKCPASRRRTVQAVQPLPCACMCLTHVYAINVRVQACVRTCAREHARNCVLVWSWVHVPCTSAQDSTSLSSGRQRRTAWNPSPINAPNV